MGNEEGAGAILASSPIQVRTAPEELLSLLYTSDSLPHGTEANLIGTTCKGPS